MAIVGIGCYDLFAIAASTFRIGTSACRMMLIVAQETIRNLLINNRGLKCL